jgi:hypothetical protein
MDDVKQVYTTANIKLDEPNKYGLGWSSRAAPPLHGGGRGFEPLFAHHHLAGKMGAMKAPITCSSEGFANPLLISRRSACLKRRLRFPTKQERVYFGNGVLLHDGQHVLILAHGEGRGLVTELDAHL